MKDEEKEQCIDLLKELSIEEYLDRAITSINEMTLPPFLTQMVSTASCCPLTRVVMLDAIRAVIVVEMKHYLKDDEEKLKRFEKLCDTSPKFCEEWMTVATMAELEAAKANQKKAKKDLN